MAAEAPKATVVATIPAHFAVALQYESGKMARPSERRWAWTCSLCARVRLQRKMGFHRRESAMGPHTLRRGRVEETIPPEHNKVVAQVIGYIMRLTGRTLH